MAEKLLELQDLKTYFFTEDGVVPAVDGVSFEVDRGGSLGVVGESGCGKSVTSLSIMRLIPSPPARSWAARSSSTARICCRRSEGEMRRIRGNEISMIFQEPMTSLNPVFTVGDQIMEAIMLHQELEQEGGPGAGHRDAAAGRASRRPSSGWMSIPTR